MRNIFLALPSLLLHLSTFAQHEFGLKASGGVSYLSTVYKSDPPQHEVQTFYFQPSGQGGLFYTFRVGEKWLLGTEVIYMPVYGWEYTTFPLTDASGNLIGESESNIKRHIHYAGLPVYAGFAVGPVDVQLGVQANFVLAGGGEEKGKAVINNQTHPFANKSDKLYINNYDLGLRTGLVYKLSDKWAAEANYYFGLTNIVKDASLRKFANWHVQHLTIGARYRLY